MAVRVPPVMSPGLSASIAEVVAMSDSAFRKRFRSSYETSPSSSSSPNLPSQKRSQGTYELIEDDKEEDKEEDDVEADESLDFDSESEDAEDEGPAAGDEGFATGNKGPSMRVESLGLGGDEAVPKGQQRAAPVVETTVGEPLGLGYRALRRWEIASREGEMSSVFECSSGLLPVSLAPSTVPLPISSPMISLTIPSLVALLAMADAEGFLTEFGAQVKMQGGLIHDHTVRLGELSPALFERYDRDIRELFTITVLALESWAGQTDAQRVALWHAISDTQIENWELRL
ncbi:hypothetical protein Tco_1342030 [Tanacetum coccineum]